MGLTRAAEYVLKFMTQKKYKILFAIGSLTGGGAERQVLQILEHLDRAQFQPQLYVITNDGELRDLVPDDVPIHSFDAANSKSSWSYPGRLHRLQVQHLSAVIRKHEIDLVYDRTYHMTLISAPATAKTNIPRISVVACEPARLFAEKQEPYFWIKRYLLRKAYLSANKVIAVSQELAKAVRDYHRLPDHRVLPICNGYDFEKLNQLASAKQLPLSAEHFHIVSAGRLHSQKNYPLLFHAIRQFLSQQNDNQIRLHVLGTGPEEQNLKMLVQQLKLEGHVQFHGFVANPYAYYQQADLCCLCSNYEGLPNMLIEAMACGTPVIATNCPSGPNEILAGGQFGALIPVNDQNALAEYISHAIKNYADWQQVADRAKTHVESTYSMHKSIKQLEDLMLDILSK